jgi:hypothetical protein
MTAPSAPSKSPEARCARCGHEHARANFCWYEKVEWTTDGPKSVYCGCETVPTPKSERGT